MLLDNYIAVFGGSFNPPHCGHQAICLWLLEALKIKSVRVVPVYEHIFGKNLVTFEQRLEMCKFMIEPFGSSVVVDDIELILPRPNTSYDLLREYEHRFQLSGKETFALIIGSEILEDLTKWHKWQELPKMSQVVVVERPGTNKSKAPFDVIEYPVSLPVTSSTEIRNKLLAGECIDGLVPHRVARYIQEKGLYRSR